ncbi:MAG: hypothetical protein RJB09_2663, partial [Pseudomonadota bacterium]
MAAARFESSELEAAFARPIRESLDAPVVD